MLYYLASTAVLALLLFYPVSRLIWFVSVRRLQKKLQRTLSDQEVRGQRNRALFLSILVTVLFAALFNYNLMGIPGHG